MAKNIPRRIRDELSLMLRTQPNPPNKLQRAQNSTKNHGFNHLGRGPFGANTMRKITDGARPTINHMRVTAALLPFGSGLSSIFFVLILDLDL
jgi:hypothetical protein